MRTFALAAILLGLLLALGLVDRSPVLGLAIYTGLAGLLVGLTAISEERA